MDSISRLIGFVAYCIASVLMVALLMGPIPEIERQYTARYNTYQQEETLRTQAREATERVQAEQWNATLRTWAWPTAAGVILVVAAVQGGRTVRHWQAEKTRRRALLVWYANRYLPGADVEILPYHGELSIINHTGAEIIPYSRAAAQMPAHMLLEMRD